jgi:hypothetical protein
MRRLASIFVYAFLVDAVLALASEWLPIAPVRDAIAWLTFGLALLLFALLAFSARLPARLLLPPIAFAVWADLCGGFPLTFVLPEHFTLALSLSQLALAIAVVILHGRWKRLPPRLDAPAFSWPRLAGFALLGAVVAPLAIACAAVNVLGLSAEQATGGYLKIRPAGLLLEERQLEKDGRHVRLVSMMHIGEKHFYESIFSSLPKEGDAIVLLEGVTDHKGLLRGRFSYAKIATLLGLASQEATSLQHAPAPGEASAGSDAPSRLEFRRADVDISTFQPLTIAFINTLGTLLADPTPANALQTFGAQDSPFQQPHANEIVMRDILENRNAHLLGEIDAALRTHDTVVVPWGAMHLPAVEAALEAQGFRETARIDRPVVRWKRAH